MVSVAVPGLLVASVLTGAFSGIRTVLIWVLDVSSYS